MDAAATTRLPGQDSTQRTQHPGAVQHEYKLAPSSCLLGAPACGGTMGDTVLDSQQLLTGQRMFGASLGPRAHRRGESHRLIWDLSAAVGQGPPRRHTDCSSCPCPLGCRARRGCQSSGPQTDFQRPTGNSLGTLVTSTVSPRSPRAEPHPHSRHRTPRAQCYSRFTRFRPVTLLFGALSAIRYETTKESFLNF